MSVFFRTGLIVAALLAMSLPGCGSLPAPATIAPLPALPSSAVPPNLPGPLERLALPLAAQEFRAAWVATVANLDWPSQPGLPAERQQAEMRAMLDRAVALKLNAIVLQVRPTSDAIYPSELEPWSAYLSGKQGQGPEPAYDPLASWIAEAHARGLELHAWFNPYRAWHKRISYPLSAQHVMRSQPGLVRSYGDYYWLDPAEPAARARALAAVAEVLRRYDVDGIQIDDYFYPYPVPAPGKAGKRGAVLDFPDQAGWQAYRAGGGLLARADWRREQVNQLVAATQALIRAEKPWVKFGISPFGIGRPEGRSPGISGFNQYAELYADAEHWLAQGWVDYLAPQLYWPVDQRRQAFAVLLADWQRANPLGRHIWPGLNTSQVASGSWPASEIGRQIDASRAGAPVGGQLHFSMRSLMQASPALSQVLAQRYATAALPPAYPWLGGTPPGAPKLEAADGALKVGGAEGAARLAVWRQYADGWQLSVQAALPARVSLEDSAGDGPLLALAVQLQNRQGQLGEAAFWRLPARTANADGSAGSALAMPGQAAAPLQSR